MDKTKQAQKNSNNTDQIFLKAGWISQLLIWFFSFYLDL
ncbi:hypothetical protein C4K40_3395 [Pseudomonas sp. CMR5c]|nr:hypothetical protein C4K40_3395 [Pseudomonas sp. CMR5c]